MSTTDLHHLGVAELAAQLKNKQVSAVEAAQHFLARAQQHQHLGAFVAINEYATLAQAKAADALIAAGQGGRLAGVPMAHKDIFVTKDFPTTAASKMLQGYQSPFDATVVRKLADAGMVTLGKLNCDEFAMGGANENSAIAPVGFAEPQPVRNPWNTERVPGGSSGVRPQRWRPVWPLRSPVPTPAARFASLHRFAASPASSPPMAAPAATA